MSREENIFIILLLYKYQPHASYTDPKLDQNFRKNEHFIDGVRQTSINQWISSMRQSVSV